MSGPWPAGGHNVGFGIVCGADYEPSLRAMLIAVNEVETTRRGDGQAVWNAVVIRDDPKAWPTGMIVTVRPSMAGFRIYAEEDEP